MKILNKSVIYSAFIFPGAGYFFLKKQKQGIVFLLLTVGCLAVICYESYYKAKIIAEKIAAGLLPIDAVVIKQEILLTPGVFSPAVISVMTIAIGTLWVVGVLDCYRLSRRI